jgi:hypothetical protein
VQTPPYPLAAYICSSKFGAADLNPNNLEQNFVFANQTIQTKVSTLQTELNVINQIIHYYKLNE